MAIQTWTSKLRLRDNDWKSLGVSSLTAQAITCLPALTEALDFEIDRTRGLVRRLRAVSDQIYTFICQYDDRTDSTAAIETDRVQAISDLRVQYDAGMTRLDQIHTQMASIATATWANNTARDAAIKQIASGVDDEALILKRVLRYVKVVI